MDESKIAIMAGNYYFSIVDLTKLKSGVNKTDTKIRMDGHTYYLYKAKTFEGSQEIDKLMDKHIEYRLSDYVVS